ncbi:MAG: CDP-alcohol phosphatidyltransferase family protein [Acidimicrobiales bacterium]
MFDGRWRAGVDRTTKPVGALLVKVGIKADYLTIFGVAMSAATAVVVGTGYLLWGIPLLLLAALPDLLDGPVAKASGSASVRGAFLDSVSDRVSDALMLSGVSWYLISRHSGEVALIPVAIMAVTFLISYERAKAESLGLAAKGGLMERAERLVLLGIALISPQGLVPVLWVFLALVAATAASRFWKVWSAASSSTGPVRLSPTATTAVVARQREAIEARLKLWRQERLYRRKSVKIDHRVRRRDRRLRRSSERHWQFDKIKAWRDASRS